MYSDNMMDKFVQDFGALKISALTSANKIKHYVKKVTIGPNATGEDEVRVTLTELNDNVIPSARPGIKSRLGPRVSTAENVDNRLNRDETDVAIKEQKSINSQNINIDMLRYETEKTNRKVVRKKVHAIQARFAKADQELQSKSNQEYNERQHFLNKRFEKIESDILEDLEKHQHDVKLQQQKKIQEHQEQCQRLHEKSLALKQEQEIRNQRLKRREELDAIYISQKSFREVYENFLRDFKSLNNSTAQQIFKEHSAEQKVLINNMEELTHKCSAGNINAECVNQAQHLVNEMRNLCTFIMSEYQKMQQIKEQVEQAKMTREVEIIKLKQSQNQEQVQQSAVVNTNENVQGICIEARRGFGYENTEHGSLENWRKIAEYKNFIEDFTSRYQQLKQDNSLKKFRFNCQKAVNIPVNSIAGKGAHHTQDKLAKLDSLLAGQSIQIGDMEICAGQHPQGVAYCYDLLAKSIVKQGGLLSGNPETAFPIAYVTVALWSKYSDFGKLVLAYFYEKCPYLVPVFPVRTSDMSEEEYLRLQGYEISSDGVLENKDLFLKRLYGMGRLYFAITIVKSATGFDHPHSLENAWKWFANTLNSAPVPDISATLILQCLEVTGYSQINHYRKQFFKVIQLLAREYIPELHKVCHGGPKARLKEILIKTLQNGMIEPPKETTEVPDVDYL